MTLNHQTLAEALLPLAHEAGAAIMAVYATPFTTRSKDDRSPVTDADDAAEAIILAGLHKLTPGIPVVAEELAARGEAPKVGDGPFWLVDPLDGTREFIERNGEFTVNIALIENTRPVLGIVLAPALEVAWLGGPQGAQRFDKLHPEGRVIQARPVPKVAPLVLVSRNHREASVDTWLKQQMAPETKTVGSSLKFCQIAEGSADFYPRFAAISEWDTAAGQAVLEAAGGKVLVWDGPADKPNIGAALHYGKPDFRNLPFLARGA
ncbi:3'(2'),5'-bisphosphate nucleotidase CysQ [Ferrovibrio sp.]|uniref:3'(2'),5'-bisphosphate nucleotidase CysQ n=1 Tax=Ferrovibrio sp. TaxID=1917215 RepID=UPI000CB67837|nr:3'(2'),5'-bisphosphate nucleotidase CysQ [Ferrovibrio sp.]PJI39470.1 MAG: 3'(2'),5'-bisphosphate nucleotidase [Ferrovibrio sp.]